MPMQPAVLGTARLGNFRLGYTELEAEINATRVSILVAGVEARTRVRRNGFSIHHALGDSPSTCGLTIDGTAPVAEQRLRVTINRTTPRLLFAGALQTVDQTYEGRPAQLAYPCTAIDDTARADRRRPFGTWTNVSATTVALAVVAACLPDYSTAGIVAGLPNVTVNLDSSEGVSGAFQQLANLIGGYWRIVDLTVYLFQTDTSDAPDPIDSTHPFLNDPPITVSRDVSQLVTRAYGKGGGSTAATAIAVGQTTLPVADLAFFETGGGLVVAPGTQRISYTGISAGSSVAQGGSTTVQGGSTTVAARPSPASGASLSATNGLGGQPDSTGNWAVVYTFAYDDGIESPPSPASNAATITDPNNASLNASSVATGPSHCYSRRFYLSLAANPFFGNAAQTNPADPFTPVHNFVLGDNSSTTKAFGAQMASSSLQPPTSNANYAAGVTYLFVADTSVFNAGGGSARVGSQVFTYTGRSTSSGVGALTGVSGITGTISIGNTIEAVVAVGAATIPVADTAVFVAGGGTATAGGQTVTYTGRSTSSGAGNLTGVTGITTAIVGGGAIVSATLAGSTTLPIVSTAAFAAGGGTARVGATTFTYTGRSTTSGAGNLTGIPASGAGALTVTVLGGATILVGAGGAGSLTGVPASGAGSVLYAINQGDPINLWVQRDDTAAQAVQAAIDTANGRTPADGIYEGPPIVDERRGTASLTALCDATLQRFSSPIVTVTYATRDVKTQVGKTVHIDLASPAIGPIDLVIQDVTISEIDVAPRVAPKFTVLASSVRFSLPDLLRRLLAA